MAGKQHGGAKSRTQVGTDGSPVSRFHPGPVFTSGWGQYRCIFGFVVLLLCWVVGCTTRPGKEELSRLEEVRTAAESAERKLAELREERIELEKVLEQKQLELQQLQRERDAIRAGQAGSSR